MYSLLDIRQRVCVREQGAAVGAGGARGPAGAQIPLRLGKLETEPRFCNGQTFHLLENCDSVYSNLSLITLCVFLQTL